MKNLNTCPACKAINSLKVYVDTMNTNFPEGSDGWDSAEYYKLSPELMVIEHDLAAGVHTCDKDRYIVCTECGAQSNFDNPQLDQIHQIVKAKNPGWV